MSAPDIQPAVVAGQAMSAGDESVTYLPQVAKGAMINLSGTVVRTLLAFGYTILLARTLPVSDLGQYFLILTIVNILGLASTLGLDFGVVRYVALYVGEGSFQKARQTLRTALLLGLATGIVVMGTVIIAAPSVAAHLLSETSQSVTVLRLFAISIPFWVGARLFNATTQGMHRMHYQVFSRDLGEQLSKLVFTGIALAVGAGLAGVVVANVASVVLAMLLSLFFAMIVMAPARESRAAATAGSSRELVHYSFPLAFSNILGMVLVWIDMLIMGYLGTATEVGFYGAALRVGVVSSAIFLAFTTVFTPVISDLYNRHISRELHLLYKIVTRWIFICTLPVVLLQLLFAEPIMNMFGSQFAAGSGALMILALSQLINAASGPAGYMVLMSGRSRLELLNISVSLAVNVAACFLLIPRYGVIGAALANLMAAVAINLLRAVEVWLFMHVHAYSYSYFKPLLAGAASASLVIITGRYLIIAQNFFWNAALAAGMVLVYIAVTISLGLSSQDSAVLGLVKRRLMRTENG
ncbi:MAG: flippase [Thermoleophilia bacterium]